MKRLISIICIMSFLCACTMLCGFKFFKNNSKKVQNDIVKQTDVEVKQLSDLWCVTFQLVWNEFSDKMLSSKPVEFIGGNPPIADELNKRLYTKDILSENSYYLADGEINNTLKKKIEKDIKDKFNETSDILDKINWSAKDSYLFYAMLKKKFTFLNAFDKLASAPFNSSKYSVKYFGVKKSAKKDIKENINVLFYNSPDEYAVKLLTNEKENVILFRTDKKDTFENQYEYIAKNIKLDEFGDKDELKVPNISVDELITYNELCGKRVKDTNLMITQAMQTIKFEMDNKGGALKSEAAIGLMRMSAAPVHDMPRLFYFDKPFVLFLIEDGKDKPYYAMNISDTKYLVKGE